MMTLRGWVSHLEAETTVTEAQRATRGEEGYFHG